MTKIVVNQLAPEILFAIARCTCPEDLISLSLVSQLFNSVATRFLYLNIVLRSLKRMMLCAKTLAKNSEAALSVRSLDFQPHTSKGNFDIPPSFFRLLNSALLQTTNLRSLAIGLPDAPHGMVLHRCYFPLMDHYSSFETRVDTEFVERHPTIKCIIVLGDECSEILPAHLPLLEVFKGTTEGARVFIPNRPVRRVHMLWLENEYIFGEDTDMWNSAAVVDSLQKSTAPDGVVELQNIFKSWPPIEIISNFATCLNLQTLLIVSQDHDQDAYIEFLDEMPSVLSELLSLLHLHICSARHLAQKTPLTIESDLVSEEMALVRQWGTLCPTMHRCTLNSTIEWIRVACTSCTFWLPEHPDECLVNQVFFDSVQQTFGEGREVWDEFRRDVWSFFNHLCPESPIYKVVYRNSPLDFFSDVVSPQATI